MKTRRAPAIVIACGGTGGHLFPGVAIAQRLVHRGCAVTLILSPKEVDQQAAKTVSGMDIITLPAVGLTRGRGFAFVRGFVQSYRAAKRHFKTQPPQAALAMGGFTGAPPLLAAKRRGVPTFIHESNTIPGRANRWLARIVDRVFVGFPQAAALIPSRCVTVTGTPVRPQFQPRDPVVCRIALGLQPALPVLLVMGGSQGAGGINELLIRALPLLAKLAPPFQLLHLAGPQDSDKIKTACAALGVRAAVHPFHADMELVLGAATAAISRAGASSLAELAAVQIPPLLIPFPAATDNHQWHNARAFAGTGAARMIEQQDARPETLVPLVLELFGSGAAREEMKAALGRWHAPQAAEQIAEEILGEISRRAESRVRTGDGGRHIPESGGRPSRAAERREFSTA